ncbi:flagellar hook protein FlgE [Spongisporangium articulatum]|uniref:Flagellar hook protein FlgE n=1 Tax=Spongisporangium articulatum TaxID=3362603 RepID=A0ABW8AJV2_9ACTN
MLRSLFSGISGLKAHQTMMDVVGNNIANVNTNGFKASNVVFEDTLSQMVRAAAAPSSAAGGLNPTQIGLGVQTGTIQTNFLQGSAQTTNKATDLMLQGDGFFVLKDGNQEVYSRAGSFTFDTDGYLINSDGNYVQGFPATNGVVDPYGNLTSIRLQVGTTIAGTPSTNAVVSGNMKNGDASTRTLSTEAFDTLGAAHNLTISLDDDGSGGFNVTVTDQSDGTTGSGAVTFTAAGANASGAATITLADGTQVDIDLTGITNYAGVESVEVKSHDGAAAGTLQSFQIAPDGTVIGIYSNGQKRNEAQLAVANFNNPQGLEKVGDSLYRSSTNSGLAQVGVPGAGGRGTVTSGSLEMSNVDLGAEFTNLIIAQRGFQANSKVITASDEMLQDLVNIKR